MIDVEKVRLMTKISIYENGQGREDLRKNRWKSSSYVMLKTIENIIYISIAYILGVVLYSIRYIPKLTSSNIHAYKTAAIHFLVIYIALVLFVWIFSHLRYKAKYKESFRRIRQYDKDMAELETYLNDQKKKDDII